MNAGDGDFSPRALAVDTRTYRRVRDGKFEGFREAITRAQATHQILLAEAANKSIDTDEVAELLALGIDKRSWVAGRTRWLGGTEYAFSRACSQFNCCFTEVANVYDVVDVVWLLLNGCGVGFRPVVGTLRGFARPLAVSVVASSRDAHEKGEAGNVETVSDGVWTIRVGDSAEAWAKAIGKLFCPPSSDVHTLVIDGSNVRGPGGRLAGYGWLCNGFAPLGEAMRLMAEICNRKAGHLLDELDILDVVNLVGTILSSRRSAQIALLDAGNPRASQFAEAKREYWLHAPWRRQSNNTLQFWSKPGRKEIREVLYHADEAGGDPGICNAEACRIKGPWYSGQNPCSEIVLPRHGFCNLVTNCLPLYDKNFAALERGVYLIARANYRQTCVDLRDGVLQPQWHQTNESLRLCGVSLTGVCQADWLSDYQIRRLRLAATFGVWSQADEWGLPRPAAVTTIKPEGTGSKAMGTSRFGEITEGIHRPLGRWIFNSVNFSTHDPLVPRLESAGYRVMPNPSDPSNVLVTFPVSYNGARFDTINGKPVNLEPAVSQLNRYLRWNNLWADHTVSCTVSYSPDEIPAIAEWVHTNWDRGFIACAFLRRADPTKTARDLGHPYLPQEVVDEATYLDYASRLRPYSVEGLSDDGFTLDDTEECKGGVCPIR